MAVQENQFNRANQPDPMVDRILDAAVQCIERYGIRRSSMGEVARVGKLSRGSIYRHFNDKESLVAAVFRRQQERFLNETEAALERLETLVEKMILTVQSGRQAAEHGLFARLADTEPETVAMMYLSPDFYGRSISFWPTHVRLAQDTGEISADIDVALATDFLMRLVVSLVMFPDMGHKLSTRPRLRNYLEQVIHQGLG